jgi:hypothetical protein
MYQFTPSPNLLPVMPGTRLYSVDPFSMTLDDDEIYAEGVVVTEDSIMVLLDGEAYELGEGLFLSREEAVRWIEQNHKASILDHLLGAFSTVLDRLSSTNHRLPERSVT